MCIITSKHNVKYNNIIDILTNIRKDLYNVLNNEYEYDNFLLINVCNELAQEVNKHEFKGNEYLKKSLLYLDFQFADEEIKTIDPMIIKYIDILITSISKLP